MERLVTLLFFFLTCSQCTINEVRSGLKFSPIYDAIIFKDMIDVFNEFDKGLGSEFDLNIYSGDDDDNIDDLLSEYQHFLDKAHHQQMAYKEKTRNKNSYTLQHTKLTPENNNDPYSYMTSNDAKYSISSFGFSPNNFHPIEYKIQDSTSNQIKKTSPIMSSCYCKYGEFPCKCKCKQCFISFYPISDYEQVDMFKLNNPKLYYGKNFENPRYSVEENRSDLINDKVNVHISVNVKLPKILETLLKLYTTNARTAGNTHNYLAKELFSVPFSYISNPISEILTFNKPYFYKHSYAPTNKQTLYKKKKIHNYRAGKKHQKTKFLTINNIKLDLPKEINNTIYTNNETTAAPIANVSDNIRNLEQKNLSIQSFENVTENFNSSMLPNLKTNATDNNYNNTDFIYLHLNISNTIDNITEDFSKLENSIEHFDEITTLSYNVRLRREIKKINMTNLKLDSHNDTTKIKKSNKMMLIDDELLYWPINIHNNSITKSKNITSLILERERKKSKINITHDVLRKNHTIALEQAIFGEIDWNDMDAFVPVFVSFVGKYIRGILSFCSATICHSMKCYDKICLHRFCLPEERFNSMGHCTGTNNTDSVAALESVMDLPSNIALEIVDILEDKMLGKMFGKATLCIASKCVTFVTSKKSFIKSKCTSKELLSTGHCPNIKIM